jgi:hypothetical protein
VAAVVAVAPAEGAIAGKRLTLIEQANGCHESMAPFFCAQSPFRDVPCVRRICRGVRWMSGEARNTPLRHAPRMVR